MPRLDYNRYAILQNDDGTTDRMPFVNISERPSDKYEYWNTSFGRMDKLANKYYGNPFYDFIIMYANPQFISEFDIPDGALIRIPFPIRQAISDYESRLEQIKNQ